MRPRRTAATRWRTSTTPRHSLSAVAEARSEVTTGLALAPNFTILGYREDTLSDNATYLSQRERILDGLRLAGAPEE
jgi:hypothetical protein